MWSVRSRRSEFSTAVTIQRREAPWWFGSCPVGRLNLVASTTSSRRSSSALPTTSGLLGTKRGLASALHSGDPAFAGLPGYFLERLAPALSALLDAAAGEGAIRGDIGAEDLLYAVAQLCQPVPGRGPEHGCRIVGVLVDGLRHGGGQARP